jgi:anti-sigma B factor antagonist
MSFVPRAEGKTPFEAKIRSSGDVVVAELSGELDLATAGSLTRRLLLILEEPISGLVLDLRKLSFVDSNGLRVAVTIDRVAREKGIPFSIVRACDEVHSVFCVAGLDKILPLVDELPAPAREAAR